MTDYSKMSDFEINKAVAISQGFAPENCDTAKRGSSLVGVDWDEDTGSATKVFDYCNNPSDAWPIICESLIGIIPHYEFTDESEEYISHSNKWVADNVMSDGKSFRYKVINPLRAAMIVYLMMKESENEN